LVRRQIIHRPAKEGRLTGEEKLLVSWNSQVIAVIGGLGRERESCMSVVGHGLALRLVLGVNETFKLEDHLGVKVTFSPSLLWRSF
jgi:hypothetical protein